MGVNKAAIAVFIKISLYRVYYYCRDTPLLSLVPYIYTVVLVSGVGFNRSRDAGWIEHQEAFDQILAGLNADTKNGKHVPPRTVSTHACLLYRHSDWFRPHM